jgi:hypothetical protein
MGARGKKRVKGYTLKYCNGKDKQPYLYIWGAYDHATTSEKRRNKEVAKGTSYYENWLSLGPVLGGIAQGFLEWLQEEREAEQTTKLMIVQDMLYDKYGHINLNKHDYNATLLANDIEHIYDIVDHQLQRKVATQKDA